jgi:hypothetical protein
MRSISFTLLSVMSVLLLQAPVVHAGIINGDFSGELSGWSTMDCGVDCFIPSASISANSDGQAVLATQGIASGVSLTSLYQSFSIPSSATTLSFDVGFWRTDADALNPDESFGINDFLSISYLDNTGDTSYDRSLMAFNADGPYNALGTLTPLSDGWYRFSILINDLANHSGTLYFDLNDQNDGFHSIAKVDNVILSSSVPESSSTILLLGIGLLFILGFARKVRICLKDQAS